MELVDAAATGLCELWQEGVGFYEDDLRRKLSAPVSGARFSWTTVRCLDSLLAVLAAYPLRLDEGIRNRFASNMLPVLLTFDAAQPDPWQPAPNDQRVALRVFRRASFVVTLTRAVYWFPGSDDLDDDARATLATFQEAARKKLRSEVGGLVKDLSAAGKLELHPFLAYRVLSALRVSGAAPWRSPATGSETKPPTQHDGELAAKAANASRTLWSEMVPDVERLLARSQLELVTPSESVRLVFSAACASVVASAKPYRDACIRSCAQADPLTRGWQQGRVAVQEIRGDGVAKVQLTIPSFEVFDALADSVAETFDLSQSSTPAVDGVLDGLHLGLRAARESLIETDETVGWPGDQGFEQLVEAWPTAAVLSFLLSMADIDHRRARLGALEELDAVEPFGPLWPGWLGWRTYLATAEPEKTVGILAYIDKEVVQPRLREPTKSRSDPVVVLLFGPPGTTKTTIARAVANGLGWPLISISPGIFIEQGMDKIEAQSTEIFDKLHSLSRAVVILDECDELFRKREPGSASDQTRGVAAFMTASMLPKVQDLHDRGRIVLFICTNFLDSIDPAMRRIGRVDHIIAVAPPDEHQRLATIKRELEKSPRCELTHLEEATATLARETKNFIRGEVVAAARRLKAVKAITSPVHAGEVASEIADTARRSITIKEQEQPYQDFLRDKDDLSGPHRNPHPAAESEGLSTHGETL
jgi:hypothetical protein